MEHRPVTVFSRVRDTMFTKLSLSCSRVSRASLILWTLSLGLHWERYTGRDGVVLCCGCVALYLLSIVFGVAV
eukprot:scaffold400020_cov43-Attheya_sp.AAC.1